jgi:DNA-binding transcriptional ArsR family regulator
MTKCLLKPFPLHQIHKDLAIGTQMRTYSIYIRILEYSSMPETLRRFKAEFFQALAHPTRIAIVELLRDGELSAGALIERLGVEQANASQHLAVLRAKHILVNRKAGNQVFYSVRDPLIIEVLDVMRRYFYAQLSEGQSMLDEMKSESATRG